MNQKVSQHYRFGLYHLNVAAHLLLRDGEPVSLTKKAFDLLRLLLEHHGRTVEKNELVKEIWPDTYVEESTIAQYIFTLRKTLGAPPEGGLYIQTIPKRGYKFVGQVEGWSGESDGPAAKRQLAIAPQHKRLLSISNAPGVTSLAVLPFCSEANHPVPEFLSQGITESIINHLAQLSKIRVIASSTVLHLKCQNIHPQEVGEQLGVQAVLDGKVLQWEDRLIVRVGLVDVAHGWQMWGEQYNCEMKDILSLQDNISRTIAEKLRLKLTSEEQSQLSAHHTENTESYELYLKGRYHWNKQTEEGYQLAIQYCREAVRVDQHFALAYAGLADAYILLDFYGLQPPNQLLPEAKAAALKAVELDDALAEAHTALGCVKLIYEWDWDAAEREFKRALALNPGYAYAHHWYSHYLLAMGRFDEALAESRTALGLDPLDPRANLHLGWYYLYTRQNTHAIEQLKATLTIAPNFWPAHLLLSEAYAQLGLFAEAVSELETARSIKDAPLVLGLLGYVHARAEEKDAAQEVLDELKRQLKRHYVPPYGVALIYTGMDEKDQAFEWLEKAFTERSEWLSGLKTNPEFDDLRADPRFDELLQRVGLAPMEEAPASRP